MYLRLNDFGSVLNAARSFSEYSTEIVRSGVTIFFDENFVNISTTSAMDC